MEKLPAEVEGTKIEGTSQVDREIKLLEIVEQMGDRLRKIDTTPAVVSRDTASDANIFSARLPIIGGYVYSPETQKVLARVIDENPAPDGIQFLGTESSGRSGYFYPLTFSLEDGIVMSAIMIKGSGSVESLDVTGSPFSFHVRPEEIRGAASITDLRLDAKISKQLHENGIRTRVALGVFKLEEIFYEGKKYTPQELMEAGIITDEKNLPGIGIFASRGMFRIQEMWHLLYESLDSPISSWLIKYLLAATRHDEASEFSEFSTKHRVALEGPLSSEKKQEIFTDYFFALAIVMGREAAKFEKLGAIVDMRRISSVRSGRFTSSHNFTCFGEIVDNSAMKFGAKPEDIMGFQAELKDNIGTIFFNTSILKDKDDNVVLPKFPYLEQKTEAENKFIDAYLDEMSPGWRTVALPKTFFDEAYFLDEESARRVYAIVQIKFGRESSVFQNRELFDQVSNFTDCFFPRYFGSLNIKDDFFKYCQKVEPVAQVSEEVSRTKG